MSHELSQQEQKAYKGRFAAIDIGTVTCRLLIADVFEPANEGQPFVIKELARDIEITNLGQGLAQSGYLQPEAISRVECAMERFTSQIKSFERPERPVVLRAVATSASRDAKNAADFKAALKRQGVCLSIIPGAVEAELSFRGASFEETARMIMVVDIGGGSTELIVGEAAGKLERAHSFNIGCRRLTDLFFKQDPPTASELEKARAWIADQMEGFFEDLRASGLQVEQMFAVAGTATTIVSVAEEMTHYDSAKVHHYRVDRCMLDKVAQRLLSCSLEERKQLAGLQPKRASVINAGMLILQCVMDFAGQYAFLVSETDILHGMLLDACTKNELEAYI